MFRKYYWTSNQVIYLVYLFLTLVYKLFLAWKLRTFNWSISTCKTTMVSRSQSRNIYQHCIMLIILQQKVKKIYFVSLTFSCKIISIMCGIAHYGLGIVHKLRSRWGGPPPHAVDYGNFFWSCFIQCWVWGGPFLFYRSRLRGGVPPPTDYVVYGRSLRQNFSFTSLETPIEALEF